MLDIVLATVGWIAWAWCIFFALGFVQMMRRYARVAQPYPISCPVLAFFSLAIAIVFLVLPDLNKLHILWIWPVAYAVGTVGAFGGLGPIGTVVVSVSEPFHRCTLIGLGGKANGVDGTQNNLADVIEQRATTGLPNMKDFIESVGNRVAAMYQLGLDQPHRMLNFDDGAGLPDQEVLHEVIVAWFEPDVTQQSAMRQGIERTLGYGLSLYAASAFLATTDTLGLTEFVRKRLIEFATVQGTEAEGDARLRFELSGAYLYAPLLLLARHDWNLEQIDNRSHPGVANCVLFSATVDPWNPLAAYLLRAYRMNKFPIEAYWPLSDDDDEREEEEEFAELIQEMSSNSKDSQEHVDATKGLYRKLAIEIQKCTSNGCYISAIDHELLENTLAVYRDVLKRVPYVSR